MMSRTLLSALMIESRIMLSSTTLPPATETLGPRTEPRTTAPFSMWTGSMSTESTTSPCV